MIQIGNFRYKNFRLYSHQVLLFHQRPRLITTYFDTLAFANSLLILTALYNDDDVLQN